MSIRAIFQAPKFQNFNVEILCDCSKAFKKLFFQISAANYRPKKMVRAIKIVYLLICSEFHENEFLTT
jgi:hypothetical protein